MVERAATLFLLLLLLCTGCGEAQSKQSKQSKSRERSSWEVDGEPPLRELARVGTLSDKRLSEASGVVMSTKEPGVFWSQNDRGNKALLFAYDSTGSARGTLAVTGARNTDWEALALGACPAGTCLYIGDVGDNFAVRNDVTILRIAEPLTSHVTSSPPERLRVAYPGGPADVETMWVAPDASIWFATKRPTVDAQRGLARSRVFRVAPGEWNTDRVVVAELIDSLPIVPGSAVSRDWITDAALSAVDSSGRRRLAVLTYGSVYLFDADPVTGRPGAQLARCAMPVKEKNAEGITWMPDGRVFLVSEGRGARLYSARCP